MSLVGNLEDLGLGDILQIVSLSRKSGELELHSRNREGRVVFRDGKVVRASSSACRANLGGVLLGKGLVTTGMLKEALILQRRSAPKRRLGAILAEEFGVSAEEIETAVKGQIEQVVYSFFGWEEGTFSFQLGDSDDEGVTCVDPLQVMLDNGLNPQWLAMEGSRILDEKRHRGESLEDEFEPAEVDVEGLLGEAADSEDRTVCAEGGVGIDAGKEPVAGSSAAENAPEEASAVPGSIDGTALAASRASLFNLGAELAEEFGDFSPQGAAGKGPESPGLHLLRGMLQELQNPALGGGIILLVLRFASELMNRAVVFAVKEPEVFGLGQFGIRANGESADARIRQIRVSLDRESMFARVVAAGGALIEPAGESDFDELIFDRLGDGRPQEVFLGPIMSEGKVVAILYGDNLPEQKSIGDTEALEIFLSQAGLAMEKAILERRLRGRRAS